MVHMTITTPVVAMGISFDDCVLASPGTDEPQRKTDTPTTQPPPDRENDPFEDPDEDHKPCFVPGRCPIVPGGPDNLSFPPNW